ncbi:MAG: hypothetical protein M1823_004254 [Watsoniomyces obsoletus]|nr:MAG: hypothetical protein M1823_004254 [Watsoniomyces obsoletus]
MTSQPLTMQQLNVLQTEHEELLERHMHIFQFVYGPKMDLARYVDFGIASLPFRMLNEIKHWSTLILQRVRGHSPSDHILRLYTPQLFNLSFTYITKLKDVVEQGIPLSANDEYQKDDTKLLFECINNLNEAAVQLTRWILRIKDKVLWERCQGVAAQWYKSDGQLKKHNWEDWEEQNSISCTPYQEGRGDNTNVGPSNLAVKLLLM